MELSDWIAWKIIIWCLAIVYTCWAPTSSHWGLGRRMRGIMTVRVCLSVWVHLRTNTLVFFPLHLWNVVQRSRWFLSCTSPHSCVCAWACLCVAGVSHFLSRIQIRLVRRWSSFQFHLWHTEKHVNTWWAGRTVLRNGCFISNWCMKEQHLREGVLSAVLCLVERAGLVYVKSECVEIVGIQRGEWN